MGIAVQTLKPIRNNIFKMFRKILSQNLPRNMRKYSGYQLPQNIEEILQSQTREVASSQAARVFGSGFLSHQGSLTEVVMEQGNSDNSVVELVSGELLGDIREVDRVEVFQRINVPMDMKTNVPEPFNADISEEMLKEGVPVGLSDSQVNLEARSNMDTRLEVISTV